MSAAAHTGQRIKRSPWWSICRRVLLGVVPFSIILVFWWWASLDSALVPSIGEVVDILIHPCRVPAELDAGSLGSGVVVSLIRVLCGFTLAVLTGIPIGILIGRSRAMRELFAPTMASFMVTSPIAWLPVAILLFGLSSPATSLFGDDSWQYATLDELRYAVIAVIWFGAFFSISLNAAAGAQAVREAHIEVVRMLGASRWQVITKVIVPAAMPHIVTGLRVGGGIAWRVIIAAEIFPGTRSGLGYMITTAHEIVSYEYAFACIVVIGLIGLLLDAGLYGLGRYLCRWQAKARA